MFEIPDYLLYNQETPRIFIKVTDLLLRNPPPT